MLKRYDVVEGVCGTCGKEFEAEYKMETPKGLLHSINDDCFSCQKKKEDQGMVDEIEELYRDMARNERNRIFDTNSLINPKLKNASFESFVPPNADFDKTKRTCMKYAKNFNKDNPVNLLMTGSYGVGKSHLAVSIIKTIMSMKFTGVFISTPKLLTKFRSTYNNNATFSETDLMNSLMRVDLLVLDDLGTEKKSDWALERIFEIIDSRQGKHTIFTTNFEPKDLRSRIGERNFSRVMDDTYVIKMVGDDYRLRNF
jgi:DNA replication protein DnaC